MLQWRRTEDDNADIVEILIDGAGGSAAVFDDSPGLLTVVWGDDLSFEAVFLDAPDVVAAVATQIKATMSTSQLYDLGFVIRDLLRHGENGGAARVDPGPAEHLEHQARFAQRRRQASRNRA
jgi:hypothetical protein